MSSKGSVLLYSPDLDGHRQVYCERWARVLLGRGFEVCVAAPFSDLDGRAFLPEFAALLNEPAVLRAETGSSPAAGCDNGTAELARLIERADAGTTVFLEADDLLPALCGQMGRSGVRMPGRRVGLFIRSTNYWYPKRRRELRDEFGWLRRLPVEWRAWPRLFHERLLPQHRLLDATLCLDEYFVAAHPHTHQWMPDIFLTSSRADLPVGALVDGPEGDGRLLGELRAFSEAHPGRELFVYFGTANVRRGYDTLLSLAVRRRGCFLHAGCLDDAGGYDADVAGWLRMELERRGDLLETGSFVADFAVADRFLSAPPAIVLPYRRHLGSSGVMLQALRVGRPVLVPAEGLMGLRVRNHGLGVIYNPLDRETLDDGVTLLWARSPEHFTASIARFLRWFSPDRVERAIAGAVEGSSEGCPLPEAGQGADSGLPALTGFEKDGTA